MENFAASQPDSPAAAAAPAPSPVAEEPAAPLPVSALPLEEGPSSPDACWYRIALLLTGSPAAAQGIMRAVYALAPEALAQLRGAERQTLWMIRQIRDRSLRWELSNAHRRVPGRWDGADSVEGSALFGDPGDPRTPAALILRLAAIPEPGRSAFILFQCADMPVEEIAALLGLGMAAFASMLHNTRRALLETLSTATPGQPAPVFPQSPLLRIHRPWGEGEDEASADAAKVAKAVLDAAGDGQLSAQTAADREWHAALARIGQPAEFNRPLWAAPPRPSVAATVLHPAVIAIALALLVVIGAVVYKAGADDDFDGKESAVALVQAATAADEKPFDPAGAPQKANQLEDWFLLNGFDGYELPAALQEARAVGHRIHRHQNIRMAEVLLAEPHGARTEKSPRLLVFPAADLRKPIDPGQYTFREKEWAVAVFATDRTDCILLFKGEKSEIPALLKDIVEWR